MFVVKLCGESFRFFIGHGLAIANFLKHGIACGKFIDFRLYQLPILRNAERLMLGGAGALGALKTYMRGHFMVLSAH
jgi:hypothetical protein